MQAVGAIIDRGVDADDMSDWLVDRHVRAGRGDHVALRERDRAVSYRELATLVARTGDALASLGVAPGARVMLVMLDSVEMVAAFLGALRVGAVPLPVNPLLGGAELGVVACDADAHVAIVSAERGDLVEALRAAAPALTQIVLADAHGATPGPTQPGTIRWSDLLASAQPSLAVSPAPSAGSYWLCTGGTTGRPKLAMHRAADLRTIWETYGRHVLGVRPDDRLYSVGPMFHAYGLGNSLAVPLAAGATAVLEPTRPPTPERVGRTVAEQRPTILFSVPTSYAALVGSDLPADAFASVRTAVSAGETLPPALFERVRERFGLELLDGIGSTELGHIFLSNRPGTARGGSCGTPVPGFRVRLLDDEGREVGPDVPANLWVAGPSAATGYSAPPRTDGGHVRRRVGTHRRHLSTHRPRRLLLRRPHRRAVQGRRRVGLAVRGRSGAPRAPERASGRGGRRVDGGGNAPDGGLRGDARRVGVRTGRARRALHPAPRRLQAAPPVALRARAAEDGRGQGAPQRAARRAGEGGIG